jgi:alpha-beta hydrolase superfamily lysophospholipase
MRILSADSDDGTRLRFVRWGDAGRDVLLVHGLAEHAGRYEHVAQRLVRAGYRVTMVELRGHGESEGQRGHTPHWHRYVEDLQLGGNLIGRPLAIVAHSMGGLVTLDALREPFTPAVVGVALSNPLAQPATTPSDIRLRAVHLLSKWAPFLPIRTELDTALLSRNREVVLAYEADPAVYPTVTVRWATEMMAATERVAADPPKLQVPLRMMLGTDDGICVPAAGKSVAANWSGPTDLVAYEGAFHELFNEPDKDVILDGLVEWLDTLEWPDAQSA